MGIAWALFVSCPYRPTFCSHRETIEGSRPLGFQEDSALMLECAAIALRRGTLAILEVMALIVPMV
jgi:hypothetical protein